MNLIYSFVKLQMARSLLHKSALLMMLLVGWTTAVNASITTSQNDCIFNWAEKSFAQFFSPAGMADVIVAPYTFRHYTDTNNYVGVSSADNNVYVLGTVFGGLVKAGTVADFIGFAGCQQQTIGTLSFSPATLTVGNTTTVSATASSGLATSFSSTTPTVCSVTNNNAVTSYTAGSCTIAADQAGDANYAAAPQVRQTITVSVPSGTVANSLSRTPWQAMITPSQVVSVSPPLSNPSPNHGDIRYYSYAPSLPAQNDSRWVSAPNGDSVNFHATSRLSSCFTQLDFSFFQTIVTIPANTNVTTFSINFAGADDGARLTMFNATYPTGLVVSNSYVYLGGSQTADLSSYTAPGVNRLLITQLDDCPTSNNIGSAIVVLNGNTVLTNQTISPITFSPTSLEVDGTTTLSATATSGIAVTYSSTTPLICKVTGSTVTGLAAGICTIAAAQTGSAAPQVTNTIEVTTPAPQHCYNGYCY